MLCLTHLPLGSVLQKQSLVSDLLTSFELDGVYVCPFQHIFGTMLLLLGAWGRVEYRRVVYIHIKMVGLRTKTHIDAHILHLKNEY